MKITDFNFYSKHINKVLCWSLLLFFCVNAIFSQSQPESVILLGNFADEDKDSPLFNALLNENQEATYIILGDITDENGFKGKPKKESKKRLDFLKILSKNNKSEVFVLGGDRDWDDNGPDGLSKIKDLEDYIENDLKLRKAFVPSHACPDPKVIEVNDYLTIIAINSQWFIHPYEKPNSLDLECEISNENDFFEEMEDILDDNADKNVLIVAHHPVYSNGQYFGNNLGYYHMLPIIGSFYNSYRKYIGNAKDYSNKRYNNYIKRMRTLLSDKESVIYASAHEHSNFVIENQNNFFINTSASANIKNAIRNTETYHLENKAGYYKLDYYGSGKVDFTFNDIKGKEPIARTHNLLSSSCEDGKQSNLNRRCNPCLKTEVITNSIPKNLPLNKDTTVIAGTEYNVGSFSTFLMGKQFRDEWTHPVTVPFLDLNEFEGGLFPYAKGGGLQTISLKFKSKNGKKYAFRQVNKKPEKSLSDDLSTTIYKDIVKDLISSQHPYGGLVASDLMSKLNILHAVPQLYVMPDDVILGEFREEFKGKIGTIEEKPQGKSKNRDGFAGAEDILQSNQMLRQLYKNSENRVDQKAYALARVFDMWLGDWDRHEDNWIWAEYESKKGKKYFPIPKDRDHVFSQWTGLVPSIVDKVVMNAEHFDYNFGNIQHLNYKARWLDRRIGNELSKEDWIIAATEIQKTLSDDDIMAAFTKIPTGVSDFKSEELADKLISRRDELQAVVVNHYLNLAKEVDVVGSNKSELFVIERKENGDVDVEIYRKGHDLALYSRTFKKEETKAINIYGLDGKDEFVIKGETNESIKIRIIGGEEKDKIENEATGKGAKKLNIYDDKKQDEIVSKTKLGFRETSSKVEYNNKSFQYGSAMPLPAFRQSSGNGFGFGIDIIKTMQGFNKPDFANKIRVYAVYYPGLKANKLTLDYWRRHVYGSSDLRISQTVSTFYDQFPYFYGFGSKTIRNNEREDNEIFRVDFFTSRTKIGLEKAFLRNSKFNAYLSYEYNHVKDTDYDNSIIKSLPGLGGVGKYHLAGLEVDFTLDFRDNTSFTKNGSLLTVKNKLFYRLNKENELYNRFDFSIAQYQTINLITDITFSARGGGIFSTGDSPFYHKAYLGSNSYLRGYTRNRFVDDNAIFYNLESKIHLGTWYTFLAPLRFGVFAFYDSGKVWGDESFEQNQWNKTYGLGMYMSPIKDVYNINFYVAKSRDKGLYFYYQLGWDF